MKNERLLYPDYIRMISCIFVIVIHVTASEPWYSLDVHSGKWACLMIYNSLVRAAVPMFVMLSGMFLLNPKKKCDRPYLTGKICNLLVVYVVWSIVYAIIYCVENYSALQDNSIVDNVKTAVLYALGSKYHLWFLPMIIGIYLLVPCLRKISEERKIMEYFLLLFMVFGILRPFVLLIIKNDIIASVVNRVPIEAVIGYAGYFVLGYYLSAYAVSEKIRKVCYLLAFVAVGASGASSIYLARQANEPQGFMTDEFSLSTFLMATAIFLFVKELMQKRKSSCGWADELVGMIAKNSLGIYLIHVFWIELLEKVGLDATCLHPILGVPLLVVIIFSLSFISSWILRKNKYLNKIM